MKKFLFSILVVMGVFLVLYFSGTLGLGGGNSSDKTDNIVNTDVVQPEDFELQKVIIEVKQGKYFVDNTEVPLAEIETLILNEKNKNTDFILEDNFASSKAWDDVKKLFATHEISVTEQ